ncbi:Rho termination factor N-terminal domain-containing protein [Alkalihalophilus marmarensis]|uniref:Rho termination factor N-terminal domain-containing protein n=1 Tax=Alkalihalophilus marmarensis TaxID=521377 RepID=UPI00203FE796|nr:Rho termination factor N-terminal domain-containing protein [Alkalihalophilus marmarensis]MCM3488785.1 Rho termination factor N-terminal domain-containing protein [Alkalihalophilus marmarensis]
MGLSAFNRARRLKKEREKHGKAKKNDAKGHETQAEQGNEGTQTSEQSEKQAEEMTIKELRILAKAKGLTGYSKLEKDELIELIGGE